MEMKICFRPVERWGVRKNYLLLIHQNLIILSKTLLSFKLHISFSCAAHKVSDILVETNRNAKDLNIIFLRYVSANSIGSNVFQSNHLLTPCSDKNIFPSSGENIDEVGGVHVVDCTHEAVIQLLDQLDLEVFLKHIVSVVFLQLLPDNINHALDSYTVKVPSGQK